MTQTEPRRPSSPQEVVAWFLSHRLPELQLEVGRLIDRENSRPLPSAYADVLLDTTLFVLIDQPIADALAPVKGRLLADLRRAAYLHGSMYGRDYEVELRDTQLPAGESFRVVTRSGYRGTGDEDLRQAKSEFHVDDEQTVLYVPPGDSGGHAPGHSDWDSGRWVVNLSFIDGSDRKAFKLASPISTVGRRSANKDLSVDIALDVQGRGISRKQLAIEWAPTREGDAAFRVYNLGLASVLIADQEIQGADVGGSPYVLAELKAPHSGTCAPGQEILVGAPDVALVIEELAEEQGTERTVVA